MEREKQKERMRRRRHDKFRMRRKARRILQQWLWIGADDEYKDWLKSSVRGFADNLQKCSCPMCGNSRKHFGEVTRQEKKFVEIERDQMDNYFGGVA